MALRTRAQAIAWASVPRPGYGGLCLAFSRDAYGIPPKYNWAITAWNMNTRKRYTHWTSAPVGAFLFFAPKGTPYGHVAPNAGNGRMYSTNSQRSHTGLYTVQGWVNAGYRYLGWSDQLNGVTIPSITGGASTATTRPTGVIRYGDRGDAVKRLQAALKISQDGSFGPATLRAVKAFQKAHGLTQDGIVGPKTKAALKI